MAAPATDDSQRHRANAGRDLREMLQERTLALREAANDLADGIPTAALFEVLGERCAAVLELRETVLARADTDAITDLISGFATTLDEQAASVPWLEEESEALLSAWREAYLTGAGIPSAQVHADIGRAIAALPAALAAVEAAQATEETAKKSLDHHETSILAKAALSRVDRQTTSLTRKVFGVGAPRSHGRDGRGSRSAHATPRRCVHNGPLRRWVVRLPPGSPRQGHPHRPKALRSKRAAQRRYFEKLATSRERRPRNPLPSNAGRRTRLEPQ